VENGPEASFPEFQVLITYENCLVGMRGMEFFDSLQAAAGGFLKLNCHLWNFKVLQQSLLSQKAIEEAIQADMIIFTVREKGALPTGVVTWAESWIARRTPRVSALVGLFEAAYPASEANPAIKSFLQEAARATGMEFFWSEMDWIGRRSSFLAEFLQKRAARAAAPPSHDGDRRPAWGAWERSAAKP